MSKVKVTIKYVSGRLGRSRYGVVRRVEEAVRFTDEDGLDEVMEQFRSRHEVVEVTISRY
jgi:hypothetical protein